MLGNSHVQSRGQDSSCLIGNLISQIFTIAPARSVDWGLLGGILNTIGNTPTARYACLHIYFYAHHRFRLRACQDFQMKRAAGGNIMGPGAGIFMKGCRFWDYMLYLVSLVLQRVTHLVSHYLYPTIII